MDFVKEVYKHSELTGKIIGCAMKVHRTLGNGFMEAIYQKCLAIEFERQGIKFSREIETEIYYEGINVGVRKMDFLVEKIIMAELKAKTSLDDVHLAQALNYLEAYKLETGLLINFGSKSLEVKRITNEYKLKNQKKS